MNTTKKLEELPKSEDKEFWGGDAESYISQVKPIPICKTHSKKNWTKHIGYIDNRDGTASCKICGWGFRIPGYMRILNEKVFDLRDK
jgi:hypothetical protein